MSLPGPLVDGNNEGLARIYKWNSLGYDYFEWGGTTPATTEWDWPEAVNKWLLAGSADVATLPFDKDEGFWFYLDSSVTANREVTLFGEVAPLDAPFKRNLCAGLNLIGNPWPISFNIQEIDATALPGPLVVGNNEGLVRIYKWNGLGYDYFEWGGTTPATPEWDWEEAENKWLLAGSADVATGITFVPNEGFWVYVDDSVTNSVTTSNLAVTLTPPAQ